RDDLVEALPDGTHAHSDDARYLAIIQQFVQFAFESGDRTGIGVEEDGLERLPVDSVRGVDLANCNLGAGHAGRSPDAGRSADRHEHCHAMRLDTALPRQETGPRTCGPYFGLRILGYLHSGFT